MPLSEITANLLPLSLLLVASLLMAVLGHFWSTFDFCGKALFLVRKRKRRRFVWSLNFREEGEKGKGMCLCISGAPELQRAAGRALAPGPVTCLCDSEGCKDAHLNSHEFFTVLSAPGRR